MPLNFVAKAAIQIGMMAVSSALTMSRKIEGPRLDSLKFSSGDYGAALQLLWGKRRVEAPIFWAEDLKEVKQERKTKGGKYNDYTYYGTFAVALAGHEISGVTRVWFDTHLVFDLTGAGPVTPFDFGDGLRGDLRSKGTAHTINGTREIADGGKGTPYFAMYLGSETQEPDPRMQATVEAEFGEGSCPAYRGTAYIVFKDIPLEKIGNRIPQVSVEVVSDHNDVAVNETFTTTTNTNLFASLQFSSDYAYFVWTHGADYEVWDVAARAPMVAGTIAYTTPLAMIGVYNSGTILAVAGTSDLCQIDPFTATATNILSFGADEQYGCTVVADGNGNEHWGTYPFSFYKTWYFDGVEYSATDWRPYQYFTDGYGDVWAVGGDPLSSTTMHFVRYVRCGEAPESWPDHFSVSGVVGGRATWAAHVLDSENDFFVAYRSSTLYQIDPATASVIDSASAPPISVASLDAAWHNKPPGAVTIWLGDLEYSLTDLSLVRDLNIFSSAWSSVYDPINHALLSDAGATSETDLRWDYIDRIDGNGVTLATIAADVADMVGVEDYSFTALDQVVKGWSATQGQASNMLEPLLDAYDSDIRPHDFQIQGVKRTGVSTGTILTERFVANDPRYAVKVRQAAELPRAVTVTFADVGADQQPNTARADRPLDATGAKGELPIDMSTWASDADESRQLTDRFHRRVWNERKEVSNALTAQHLSLEPGDCRTLDLDGESDIYRLVRLTVKANGELAAEWKYDHPSLALIDGTAGASFDGRNPSVIVVPGLSRGFALDIPLIRDVDTDSNPQLYLAAGPYSGDMGFPGAVFYQAVDDDYTEEVGSVQSSSRATWGYTTDILTDANPNVWDLGTTVNVVIQVGSLTGCTQAEIDANPFKNLILIGDEILNFTTATLEVDGSYTLSGLKRGRRGTEWATGTHAARDVVLLLNNAEPVDLGLSEVGTDLSFKAVTNGRTLAGAFPIDHTPFSGASLKPYAPSHLKGTKDASSGDWALTWVRRTRVGGAWTGGTSIPLSENSEEYEVEILDGVDVVRTITGLTSPAATWTAAQQTTDFGLGQSAVHYRVYQISDAVDRGFPAEWASDDILSTQWRMLFTTGAVSGALECRECEMREWSGGADQCNGGTPSASTEYTGEGGVFRVAAAFDNIDSYPWTSTNNTNQWLQYTFAVPVTVREFSYKVNQTNCGPQAISFQYWDSNSGAWVTSWSVSGLSWSALQTQTFTKP